MTIKRTFNTLIDEPPFLFSSQYLVWWFLSWLFCWGLPSTARTLSAVNPSLIKTHMLTWYDSMHPTRTPETTVKKIIIKKPDQPQCAHFGKEMILQADFSEALFVGLLDDLSILGQLRDISLFWRYRRCDLELVLGTVPNGRVLCQECQIFSSKSCVQLLTFSKRDLLKPHWKNTSCL